MNEHLNELGWIAYMAQELGWTGLANRIAEDAVALQKRCETLTNAQLDAELACKRFQLNVESYETWCELDYGMPYPNLLQDLGDSWYKAEQALNYLTHNQHLERQWDELTSLD